MNWFTRIFQVEKIVEKTVEKTILGSPERTTLYLAEESITTFSGYGVETINLPRGYYHSCAQALAENPTSHVREVVLWRVGDEYVSDLSVTLVNVRPKPKRGKGKTP